jgi:hypothetical protein
MYNIKNLLVPKNVKPINLHYSVYMYLRYYDVVAVKMPVCLTTMR